MPAGSTLTINDRMPTPVAHNFNMRRKGENGSVFFHETAAFPIGENIIAARWRDTPTVFNRRMTITMPELVTEVINGVNVPNAIFADLCNIEFRFDRRSSEQRRKNLVGFAQNVLAASVTDANKFFVGLEGFW